MKPQAAISINHEMRKAISEAHQEAQEACNDSRTAIDTTITKRRRTAALVHKFSRFHKQDLCGALQDVFNAEQVKTYMAIHQAAMKRPEGHDKRQLVLCGIIDQQQGRGDEERETAAKPSAVSLFAKSVAAITKAVEDRPVADWTDHECEQVASMYAPILAVMDEVESRGA
jgi:hypothetical protein